MTDRRISAVVICFFLFALTPSADATLPKEQMYALFTQANNAFRQANAATDDVERERLYEKAILSFEKVINDGQIRNAKLYYNLANAYFLEGNLGKAILNYRRAEKLDKADGNIQKNLRFARDRRIDKVKVKTEKRVLQTLFFWHYDFSIRTKFVLICICFAIVCISLSAIIWFGRVTPAAAIAVIGAVCMACFLASVVLEAGGQARKVCGVITAQEVVARQGDGQSYPVSFKDPLHAGTEFDLIRQHPGWFHIRLGDGSDGWIPESSADLI